MTSKRKKLNWMIVFGLAGLMIVAGGGAIAEAVGPGREPGRAGPNAVPNRVGGGHALPRQRIMLRFDADKNGTLNDAERTAARQALQARIAQRKAARVERFDADKDGALSEAERNAARQVAKARISAHRAKMMSMLDVNRDGKLDRRERARAHSLAGHRADHRAGLRDLKQRDFGQGYPGVRPDRHPQRMRKSPGAL